jgi:hypothetical protein
MITNQNKKIRWQDQQQEDSKDDDSWSFDAFVKNIPWYLKKDKVTDMQHGLQQCTPQQ